jgi:uncharacterized damage-inducible protein DinB
MSEVPRWFGRRFHSEPALDLHPNVRARLAVVAGRVAEVVAGLPRAVLVRRFEGKWSIQEHAGHLADLDELFARRIDEYLAGKPTLSPADLDNEKTEQAHHNEAKLDDIAAALRGGRAAIMARLDSLSAADFGRVAVHPRLQQPMRLLDLLVFVAEHDDHHLAKMRELVLKHDGANTGFRAPDPRTV